jgi:hypothetical protein
MFVACFVSYLSHPSFFNDTVCLGGIRSVISVIMCFVFQIEFAYHREECWDKGPQTVMFIYNKSSVTSHSNCCVF